MLGLWLVAALSTTNGTQDYCGKTWEDADKRCHAPCLVDADCSKFSGEICYSQCDSCKVDPTPAPTPPPPPTPKLQPLIMKGCPTEHPPGAIAEACAETIASIWGKAGGTKQTCQVAVSVSLAESGGDAHVQGPNSDGSIDRGLWQLNSRWHPEVSDACAYDPECNAKETFRISKQGTNF